MEPNRDNGSWLKGNCPHRVRPCGNAACADEAMHAAEQKKSNGLLALLNALQSIKNARRQAERCQEEGHACAMDQHFGNRFTGIDELSEK